MTGGTIAAFEYVSFWEAAITAIGFVGLIVALYNVSEAMRDLMLGLAGQANELVPVVAWNNVRGELFMVTVLSVYVIAGVMGMLTPPNPAAEATVTAVVGAIMAIGLELFAVANSFANRRDRQVLRRPLTTAIIRADEP